MIYLASPYSHADPEVMEDRFRRVCAVASRLMLQGLHIFSPIAHCHPIAVTGGLPKGWEFWGSYDKDIISKCDRFLVLRLPGWEESKGVQAEIKIWEEMGGTVEYVDE